MELLSGPDLGAGFLFQLTVDRSPPDAELTYHAQEGGIDASGPPKGSPTPFGFRLSTAACPIGGRECYHRRFEIREEDAASARLVYNRFRFVMAARLEQQYRGAPIPFDAGLTEVAGRLRAAGARWFVGGSAAARLQGVAVEPHDLDLGTDARGVGLIAEALRDYLIEPVGRSIDDRGKGRRGARAYVGTLLSGVAVEWAEVGPPDGPTPGWSEFDRPFEEVPLRVGSLGGLEVPVVPLEFPLVRAAVRHDRSRVAAIQARRGGSAPEATLLRELLEGTELSETERSDLLRPGAG